MNKKIKPFGLGILFGFWVLSFGFSASAATFSNPELTSVTDTSIVITWSTTDEASTTEISYGIGSLTDTTSVIGSTKYHYLEVSNLLPNTTYKYRLKSGTTYFPPQILDPLEFTTLSQPTGELLFTFAVFNGTRYAPEKSNTTSANGIAYDYCEEIVDSIVSDINAHDVAFTVVNGNLAENSSTGDQVGVALKAKLETLTGASDLPSGQGYKYLPTPGYEDRTASYDTDWLTDAFIPITTDPTSSESRYGYVAADNTKNSIFNFQFKYKYYNFIFLDSTKNDGGGLVSVEALNNYLSAEANSKTFVFTNYPAYNPFDAATKDYPIDIPTTEVSGGIFTVDNAAAFRATLESYTTAEAVGATQIPITAAVISGHIGDNYLRTIGAIPYIRQTPSTTFPCGYSIYKVYSNGFIKTFYKTDGRVSATDKPYYEYTRDLVSAEGGVLAGILQSIWLGTNSLRNFTKTYPFIPGVAPTVRSHSPANGESSVNLNKPLIIRFNKRMDTTNLNSWVTISPAAGTITAQFLDSDRTMMQVNHSSNFTQGQTYTVTVSKTYAKDEGLTPMDSNYTFTFDTTGGSVDTDYPTAYINPLSGNYTTDPYPSFTGIATGENGVIAIQYKIDDTGDWISAEAVDGTFSSTNETFRIVLSSPLATGLHAIWLKTTDAAGNTSATGFNAYGFTVAQENPEIASLLFDSKQVIIGDPIDSTPKIEITITAINSLESARLTIGGSTNPLSFAKVSLNYYGTYEVTTALADGIYGVTIEAFDILAKGTTYEVSQLYIQSSADVLIQGIPLNYPNPYDPATGNTTIGYTLSKPANISLNIFDLSGNLIYKQAYTSAQEGGKAGYNEITWNGQSNGGNYVGNGIYIFVIIADGKVVQNGKGKITIFKQ